MASLSPILGENDFPSVLSAVQLLPPAGHLEISRSDLLSTHSASVSARAGIVEGFHLVLVLHLLVSSENTGHASFSNSRSTVDAWHDLQLQTRRKHNLALLAGELLEYIARAVEYEGDLALEDILCAEFSLDSSRVIRVIDLLSHPGIPPEILRHPLITVAISKLWRYLKAHPSLDGHGSRYFQRFLSVYDSSSAPRIHHAVHLAFHTVYLILLAQLILYPAPLPISLTANRRAIGVRESLVTIYNVTNVLFCPPLSLLSLPHILVILAFVFSLSESPSSGSLSYTAMLCAFGLHVLFLQLPIPPTPIFLVEPAYSLPLSSLYSTFFTRCFLPIFAFFLPAILTSVVLVSISLSETLLRDLWTMNIFAAPSAARVTFLVLLFLSLFLALFFFVFVLLLAPSTVGSIDTSDGPWEGFGAGAGISGRRALIRAINSYSASPSGSIVFPPPLNILSLPLVVLSVSWRTRKIVWRIIVGPVAFLIAAFWRWGVY